MFHQNQTISPLSKMKRQQRARYRAISAVIEKSVDMIRIETGADETISSDTAIALMLLESLCDYIEEI